MVQTDLKNIVDGLEIGIIELNEKLSVKYCNKAWLRNFKFSKSELLDKSIADFLTIGSLSSLKNTIASQPGNSVHSTLWFKDKTGEILSCDCCINKSEDESSWLIQIIRSGKKEKPTINKISDLYYEVDEQHNINLISTDIEQKLFYLAEECLYKSHDLLYEDPNKRNDFALQIKDYGEIQNHRDTLISKKGEKINVLESLQVIADENGRYKGFSCVSRFVGEKPEVNNPNNEYIDRYQKLWSLTNEGLILHKEGKVIDVNSRVESMLGYSRKEVVGNYIIDQAVKEEWKEVVMNKIVSEDSSPYEIEAVKKNGEVIPVELESRNIALDGEKVRITAIRDLTDRRAEGKLTNRDKFIDFLQENLDKKTGQSYFQSVILQISRLLKADMVFVGRFNDTNKKVYTIASSSAGLAVNNFEYDLKDSPCEQVRRSRICVFPDKLDTFFPKDLFLKENNFKGYVGVELKSNKDESIGILVVLFKRKIINEDFAKTVVNIFSQRIEIELERLIVEEKLINSRNMLQLILDNIPVNVYWKDKNLYYKGGNKSFLIDAGLKDQQALENKTDHDMPWSEEADLYSISDRSVLRTGRPRLNEDEPQSIGNGGLRWIRTSKVPMKDNSGNTIGLLGISEDITEKKFIESSILESENRFRNLAENIPGVIYSCRFDIDCSFIYLNENIKDLTGYSKSSFIEEHVVFKNLIHPDDLNYMFEQKKMAVQNHTAYQIQYRLKHKNGDWKWVEESGVGVFEGDELLHLEGVMIDVSSRVEAEKLNRENEIKFRLLIENLTGVFWITDLKTRKLEYISPQYESIWGRPTAKAYEDPADFIKSIHQADQKRVFEKFKRMEEGELFEDVYRIIDHNQNEKTIWSRSSLYKDEISGNDKIIGYAEDITEKRKIERTLKESETKFKTLIENLDGVTYILNTETKQIEYVSPQYEKIFESKCENLLADASDFMKKIHQDDLAMIFENIKKVDEGQNIIQKFRIKVEGGEKIIFGKVSHLKDDYSSSPKVIGYSQDVTASENAKREIEKLALVSQKTNNAIIITNDEGKIEWINDAYIQLSGYKLDDIKNQFIENYLFGPGTSEENISRLKIGIDNRLKVRSEAVFKSINNKNRWVEISINPVFDEKGAFQKLFAVLIDITDRKRHEEAIKKQNLELIKTNQELDNFVYRVSHDLKAPISSVKGLVNIIKLEKNRSNIEDCVDRIEESMDKLDHFILDILDYSRNSRFEIEPAIVDVEKELNSVFTSLRYLDQSESISKSVTIQKDADLYSDKRRIKFIINNLVSNAIRFADPIKDHQKIDIDIKVDRQKCLIICSDNGIGIEKEYIDRIFEMFFRATEVKAGSGLGLYIVKEAVDKLGGKIKVDSVEKEGSTFEVYLPNMISEITGD